MARADTGCDVWEQDFLKLDLPAERFDGVFANASLFHVPTQELPRVLRELRATLRNGGVLFSSNPHGDNSEGWSRGRYGAYHDLETWQRFLIEARIRPVDALLSPRRVASRPAALARVRRAQAGLVTPSSQVARR